MTHRIWWYLIWRVLFSKRLLYKGLYIPLDGPYCLYCLDASVHPFQVPEHVGESFPSLKITFDTSPQTFSSTSNHLPRAFLGNMGKWSNLSAAYFWDGGSEPPTRNMYPPSWGILPYVRVLVGSINSHYFHIVGDGQYGFIYIPYYRWDDHPQYRYPLIYLIQPFFFPSKEKLLLAVLAPEDPWLGFDEIWGTDFFKRDELGG